MHTLEQLKKEEQEITKKAKLTGRHQDGCPLYMPRGIDALIPMSEDACTCGLKKVKDDK